MSRRLVLLVSAAAAAMGGLAYADPGCFGPSCRMTPQALMPALQDPPRLVLDAQSMDATGNLVDVTPPPITDGKARAPHSGAEPAASTKPVPEAVAQTATRSEKSRPAVTAGPVVNSAVRPTRGQVTESGRQPEVQLTGPQVRPNTGTDPVPQVGERSLDTTAGRPEAANNKVVAKSAAGTSADGLPPIVVPSTSPGTTVSEDTVPPAGRSKGAKPVPSVAEGSPAEERFQQRIRQIQRLRQAPEPVRTRPVEQAQSLPEQTLPVHSPESRRSKPDSGPDNEATREPRREARESRRVRVVSHGPEPQVQVTPPAPPVRIEAQIGGEVIVVSQPDAFDNRWRRCQVARDGRPVRCSTGSYHPYGSGGYRPYGDYRAYAPTPGYIRTAPGPRIISIVTD